jgi:HEAT repeat protein
MGCIDSLRILFKDPEEKVRKAAFQSMIALSSVTDIEVENDLVKPVLLLLHDPDAKVRTSACYTAFVLINEMKNMTLINLMDALIFLLQDKNEEVRYRASYYVCKLIPVLRKKELNLLLSQITPLLENDTYVIQSKAGNCLTAIALTSNGINLTPFIPTIMNFLHHERFCLRETTCHYFEAILGCLDVKIINDLLRDVPPLLRDDDWQVRKAALNLLNRILFLSDEPIYIDMDLSQVNTSEALLFNQLYKWMNSVKSSLSEHKSPRLV